MIDLVDDEFVHAPATAGARFSGGDAIFDNGGKSADWKKTGGSCCKLDCISEGEREFGS
jgi:hypothetical protein